MQEHIKNRLESRNKDWTEWYYECERCGKNNWCDVHHIIFRSQWWSNEPINLIMLCRECHRLAHEFNSYEMKEWLTHRIKDLID